MHERISRDIQPERFHARTLEHQVLDEESFAAAHVEHSHARFETKVGNDVSCHGPPASVVAVSAVSVLARPVPVHFAKFLGNGDDFFVLALGALLDVALGTRQGFQQVHFGHQLFSGISWCTRATPSSSGMKWISGNALIVSVTS